VRWRTALSIAEPGHKGAMVPQLKLSDFPIPAEIEPDSSWTPQMREIASYIGPRATLLFCEAFGGRSAYLPRRADGKNWRRFCAVVGEPAVRSMIGAFAGCHLAVPRAAASIARARRAGVLAHARAGTFSIGETAEILGVTRNYAGWLVNHSGEGLGVDPAPLPLPRECQLLSEAAAEACRRLTVAGIGRELIDNVAAGIVTLGGEHLLLPVRAAALGSGGSTCPRP
jgi:hypothetical protein